MAVKAIAVLLALAIAAPAAHAQGTPATPATPAEVLREGNTAATAGDWMKVSQLVDPLLRGALPPADLAEARRLAGLAAFFQGRRLDAETHFLAYLRIDLDAQLDPALYPPEVVTFFTDIKAKYNGELRARRPKQTRRWYLTLLPPLGQWENGEKTKAVVIGGVFGAFLVANISSAIVLRSWCKRVSDTGGSSLTCDEGGDHYASAPTFRAINVVGGVGAILTYVYGVYDGVKNYRRRTREASMQPFVSTTARGESLFGVIGRF